LLTPMLLFDAFLFSFGFDPVFFSVPRIKNMASKSVQNHEWFYFYTIFN
jgi:hypothetical protein